MKKVFYCKIVWMLFFVILCGWGFAQAEKTEKITTIRIATPEWENQTHKDGTGLFFDIVRAVYEPVGIKMEFKIVPWERAEKLLIAGQADARLAVYITDDQIIPKNPLYIEYTVVIFKKDKVKEWNGIKTVDGKNLVWMRGYDFQEEDEFKGLKVKWYEVDSYVQAWDMLKKERVDFYLDALVDVERYIKSHNIDMSPYQMEDFFKKKAYIGFTDTERSKKLIEIYDKRFPELLASGELQKLFEKWNMKRQVPDAEVK